MDIDPDTWTMDPAALEAAITPRTKAILPVHLHGRLADMDGDLPRSPRRTGWSSSRMPRRPTARSGAGVRAGAFGDIGCFSFYPGKNLGACGEGGAVTTDRADLAEAVRSLRDWGQEGKYNHVRHGFNYRMDAVQGAALGVKLRHLDDWNVARRRLASAYEPAGRRRIAPGGPVRRRPRLSRLRHPRARPRRGCADGCGGGHRHGHPLSRCRCTCSRPMRRSASGPGASRRRGLSPRDPVAAALSGDSARRRSRGSSRSANRLAAAARRASHEGTQRVPDPERTSASW